MLELVTIQQARQHLRLDSFGANGPDDAWLNIFIPAISQAVAGWLKDSWRLYVPLIDSSGEVVIDSSGDPVPDEPLTPLALVQAAVLIELDRQYQFRAGEGTETDVPTENGWGYTLGKGATAILSSIRKPTVS